MEADIEKELSLWIVLSVVASMLISVGYGIYSNFFRDHSFTSRTIGAAIPLFTHQAVRRIETAAGQPLLSFVYKVSAEVGELGDNVRALRSAISGDPLLHKLLEAPRARAEVLGHTQTLPLAASIM